MTTVIGYKHGGRVYIASDYQVTCGWMKIQSTESKSFSKDNFIFGVAGSVRDWQVVQHLVNLPKMSSKDETDFKHWLVVDFVPELQRKLAAQHRLEKEDGIQHMMSNFLIGFQDKLVKISEDFSVMEYTTDFTAIGSGSEFALAAMEALLSTGRVRDPERLLTKALEIAGKYDLYSNTYERGIKIISTESVK